MAVTTGSMEDEKVGTDKRPSHATSFHTDNVSFLASFSILIKANTDLKSEYNCITAVQIPQDICKLVE